jgi:hypothetical protein
LHCKRGARRDIQDLYESDASGMLDEDLLEQVHHAIHQPGETA